MSVDKTYLNQIKEGKLTSNLNIQINRKNNTAPKSDVKNPPHKANPNWYSKIEPK